MCCRRDRLRRPLIQNCRAVVNPRGGQDIALSNGNPLLWALAPRHVAESSSSAQTALHRTLGYVFRDPALLQAALIHTSYVNERPGRGLESNERLEFLGDAVLGVIVAHRLYVLRPESPEGELTVLRAWLVRQSTLARWARQVGLGQFLLLGRGEARGGGRDRPALLSRGFEAVIGAI